MMKILVTGCAGFIGFHLIKELIKDFKDVSVIGVDTINDYYSVKLKKATIGPVVRIQRISI